MVDGASVWSDAWLTGLYRYMSVLLAKLLAYV